MYPHQNERGIKIRSQILRNFGRKNTFRPKFVVLALSVCSITAFAVGEDDSQLPIPSPIRSDGVCSYWNRTAIHRLVYKQSLFTPKRLTTEYVGKTEEPTARYVQPWNGSSKQEENAVSESICWNPGDRFTWNFRLRQSNSPAKKYSTSYGGNRFVDLRRSWEVAIVVILISTKVGARKPNIR